MKGPKLTAKAILKLIDQYADEANTPVAYFYDVGEQDATRFADEIVEDGRDIQLTNKWHVRFDVAKQPNQQNHLHVMRDRNQICVINKDGSPSHRTVIDIPKKIRDKIRELNLVIIEGQLILAESASFRYFDVAKDLMIQLFEYKTANSGGE